MYSMLLPPPPHVNSLSSGPTLKPCHLPPPPPPTHTNTHTLQLVDLCAGSKYLSGSSTRDLLLVYCLPTSLWIVLPAVAVWQLSALLAQAVDGSSAKGGQRRKTKAG